MPSMVRFKYQTWGLVSVRMAIWLDIDGYRPGWWFNGYLTINTSGYDSLVYWGFVRMYIIGMHLGCTVQGRTKNLSGHTMIVWIEEILPKRSHTDTHTFNIAYDTYTNWCLWELQFALPRLELQFGGRQEIMRWFPWASHALAKPWPAPKVMMMESLVGLEHKPLGQKNIGTPSMPKALLAWRFCVFNFHSSWGSWGWRDLFPTSLNHLKRRHR